MSSKSNVQANEINMAQWTLFDKVMYGGLGYGAFCLPTNFFKIVIAVIFPPLGEVVNIINDTVSTVFPYVNLDVFSSINQRHYYPFILFPLKKFLAPSLAVFKL